MIRITKIQIPELPTAKPRRLYIYLPQNYAVSGMRFPVLYMFDGHNVFYDSHATYGKCWGMKEYLARTKLPLIVAAIECNHEGDRRFGRVQRKRYLLRRLPADAVIAEARPLIDQHHIRADGILL